MIKNAREVQPTDDAYFTNKPLLMKCGPQQSLEEGPAPQMRVYASSGPLEHSDRQIQLAFRWKIVPEWRSINFDSNGKVSAKVKYSIP